jgi:sarcosine oxidase subunit alpha
VTDTIRIVVDGTATVVPAGTTVAAALGNAGRLAMHRSVTGEPRGPVCGMGICFECRVTIDGAPHTRSCMVRCVEGMEVVTEHA